ncbi:MAG: HAD family hydrolase [Clostridiaceae bacterium]|nr:HAD family hydrolase [Clostridiaceae bacterium]
MPQTILFDLDGTLTDPAVGITRAVAYALAHYGITVEDLSTLHPFIGPPLDDSFERFFGFSHERAVEAIGIYREYFRDTGIFENEVYPGIPEMLEKLQAAGKTLVVATSKPEPFAVRILDHFCLARYFTAVVGSELDGTRVKKDEVIAEALKRNGMQKRNAVMVGDREHDVRGAGKVGLPCVGVLYGYGSRAELTAAGAAALAETPEELCRILTGEKSQASYVK